MISIHRYDFLDNKYYCKWVEAIYYQQSGYTAMYYFKYRGTYPSPFISAISQLIPAPLSLYLCMLDLVAANIIIMLLWDIHYNDIKVTVIAIVLITKWVIINMSSSVNNSFITFKSDLESTWGTRCFISCIWLS